MSQQLKSSKSTSSHNELNEACLYSQSNISELLREQHSEKNCFIKPSDKSAGSERNRPVKTKPICGRYQTSIKQSLSKLRQAVEVEFMCTQSPRRKQARQPNQSKQHKSPLRTITLKTASVPKLRGRRVMVLTEQVCSICLSGLPDDSARLPCSHTFCLECIEFWAQSSTKCPYCRKEYGHIIKHNGQVIVVESKQPIFEDPNDYIYDPCYICETFDEIPTLLLCDRCENKCCHINCDPRIIRTIPDEWVCTFCQVASLQTQLREDKQSDIRAPYNKKNEDIDSCSESDDVQPKKPIHQHNLRRNTRKPVGNIASRTRSKANELLGLGNPLSRDMMRTRQQYRRGRI